MKKIIFIGLAMIFANAINCQEDVFEFSLPVPDTSISNSYYNKIEFIDSRIDTGSFGYIKTAGNNKKVPVITKISLEEQLSDFIRRSVVANTLPGTLLLQLRYLNFGQTSSTEGRKQFCYLRINLFRKSEKGYHRAAELDSVISIDLKEPSLKLVQQTQNLLSNFLYRQLSKDEADAEALSRELITRIDVLEKKKIKLYTAQRLTDGIYFSYASLKNQTPDKKDFILRMSDKEPYAVYSIEERGKQENWPLRKVYAVVHEGKMYVTVGGSFYEAKRRKDDFYVVAPGRALISAQELAQAYFFKGIIGQVKTITRTMMYEMKIDYLTGAFIRIHEQGR
jgi:hypothetical protein